MDIANLPADEIAQHIPDVSSQELKEQASLLSLDQIYATLSALNSENDKNWVSKFEGFIDGLNEYKSLEVAGKRISLEQALELLNFKGERWKLSPLFVGIPHSVFTDLIVNASSDQMESLKEEAITEPIQHQMSVLTHEILKQIPAYTRELETLEKSIQMIDPEEIGHREMLTFSNAIHQGREFFDETISKINKLLVLAWNTNRTDLIEKLSHAKELSLKIQESYVGNPSTASHPPTGLFAKLEERLSLVYGNPNDPKDIEAVDDDEPVIEALVKFSVWYLHDYWNMGLLPQVSDPQGLNPSGELSPKERQALHESLLNQVKENLNRIGLNRAVDLKKAGIFSKQSLQEYIAKNAFRLKPE